MTPAIATSEIVMISCEACWSIANWATTAHPEESCGVLIGRSGHQAEIVAAWTTPNRTIEDRTRRFALAPADLYDKIVRARSMALDVVGFFHSHPVGDAQPSRCDIRDAGAWPGYIHVIYACAPREGDRHLRIYRTDALEWHEVALQSVN